MNMAKLIKPCLLNSIVLLILFRLSSEEIHRANSQQQQQQCSSFNHSSSSSSPVFYAVLATCVVGSAGIVPLIFIPFDTGAELRKKNSLSAKRLEKFLSFAVGALLGDVFLHLLPEAYANVNPVSIEESVHVGLWVLVGLVSFMTIEMLMNGDDSGDDDDDDDDRETKGSSIVDRPQLVASNQKTKEKLNESKSAPSESSRPQSSIAVSGYLNLFANVIDNFTHGLAVGGSYRSSLRLGHLTTLAILLHEVPHEISDFAILLRAGFDRWGAAKAQILTASGSLLGAFVGLNGGAFIGTTSWILPFTSGGFLYISLVSVVPDLINQNETLSSAVQQIFFILLGVLSMSIVNVFHT